MRKLLNAILMAFVLIAFVGCGPAIRDGAVVSHRFSPAHDEEELQTVGEISYWETVHYPDRWYVTIGKTCEDGKYRTSEFLVTKETHDRLKEGDWANFDK
jgi:hypothetical protein